MNDNWPPPSPPLRRQFTKQCAAEPDAAPNEATRGMITCQQIEELEKQRKQPIPHLILTPSGSRPNNQIDAQRLEGIERLKQRMQERQAKIRDDFQIARER